MSNDRDALCNIIDDQRADLARTAAHLADVRAELASANERGAKSHADCAKAEFALAAACRQIEELQDLLANRNWRNRQLTGDVTRSTKAHLAAKTETADLRKQLATCIDERDRETVRHFIALTARNRALDALRAVRRAVGGRRTLRRKTADTPQ